MALEIYCKSVHFGGVRLQNFAITCRTFFISRVFLPKQMKVSILLEKSLPHKYWYKIHWCVNVTSSSKPLFSDFLYYVNLGALFHYVQLLLALLGCVIQDKSRERFVEAALSTDEQCQFELKEMIEAVLFMNNMETQLPEGFGAILKVKRGMLTNRNYACLFLWIFVL